MSYYSMAYMYQTVRNMYDSDKWHWRVRNMSDNQIMAIFYDKLEKDSRKKEEKHEPFRVYAEKKDEYIPEQLSFFE